MSNPPDGQKLARFRRTEELFSQLIKLDPSARASALSAACANDAELQRAVEGLLRAHDDASKVWPALTVARDWLMQQTRHPAMEGRGLARTLMNDWGIAQPIESGFAKATFSVLRSAVNSPSNLLLLTDNLRLVRCNTVHPAGYPAANRAVALPQRSA